MRKVIKTTFIVAAVLLSFCSLFSQTSITSPYITIKGNTLARYGQEFLLYCLLDQPDYDNISVTVTVFDSENNIVAGLTPLWGENLILDSFQLKSETPFTTNKGKSLFSFELVAPFDTSDYTVRVVAFSKNDANSNTVDWIDSSEYVVKTSRQNLPVVKVNDFWREDFVVNSFNGNLDEGVTQTFNNVIENTSEFNATISKLEIFGINGTSDSAFTLISPIKDSSFTILSRQKIPITVRFKPDTIKYEHFSAVIFINTINTVEAIEAIRVDGYIFQISPSVKEKYSSFQICPNPVLSTATISIPTLEEFQIEQEIDVIVNDLQGNIVFFKKFVPSIIEQKITFLPKTSGTFSVSLRNQNEILSTKFFQVLK